MAEKKIEVLNPVGEVEVKARKLAPRPKSLQGLRLGVLDNNKHNADHFLNRAGKIFRDKFGLREVIIRNKPSPGLPVPQDIRKVLSDSDLLLTAFGD